MAIRCDDCRYLFSSYRKSCPYCGGRVYRDSTTDEELLQEGYTPAPLKHSVMGSNGASGGQSLRDDDPFQDLRNAYQEEHGHSGGKSERQSPRKKPAQASNSVNQKADPPPSSVRESGTITEDNAKDFFEQFRTGQTKGDAPTSVPDPSGDPASSSEPHDEEMRNLRRQQNRLRWQSRRTTILNTLSHLSWHRILPILLILIVIFIVMTIWKMRSVIFQSFLTLLEPILMIAIMIVGIWLIIRSIFR